MSARVHVEGGGTGNKALKAECRRAFREFFTKAGFAGRLPRVVPGGGRRETYDDFCTALSDPGNDAFTVLLVDSEAPVAEGAGPWTHLRDRLGDGWNRPRGAADEHAHLMVQCMEAWFLADPGTVSAYFGNRFRPGALIPVERMISSGFRSRTFSQVSITRHATAAPAADTGRVAIRSRFSPSWIPIE